MPSFLGGYNEGRQQLTENKRADATLAQQQSQFDQRLNLDKQTAQQDQLNQIQQRQDLIEQGTAELISKVKDKSAIQGKIEAMAEAYAANEKLKNRLNGIQMTPDDFELTKQNFIESMNALPTKAEAYQQETGMMIGRDRAISAAQPDTFKPATDEGKRFKEMNDVKRIYGEDSPEYKQLNSLYSQGGRNVFGDTYTEELAKKSAAQTAEKKADAREEAAKSKQSIATIEQGMGYLDDGMTSGFGANFILGAKKALQSAGVEAFDDDIKNTEAYQGLMGRETMNVITAFGSGTGLSDNDRIYANKIAGGEISASKKSMKEILRINRIANLLKIDEYNQDISKFTEEIKGSSKVYKKVNLSDREQKEVDDYRAAWEKEQAEKANKKQADSAKDKQVGIKRTTASGIQYTVEK